MSDNRSVASSIRSHSSRTSNRSVVEVAQLRAQIKLLNKTHIELKGKIETLEAKVAQQEEELAAKDTQIRDLHQGLEENLQMLQELEELENQAKAKAPAQESVSPRKKELKRQLRNARNQIEELEADLEIAQDRINELQDQLTAARAAAATAAANHSTPIPNGHLTPVMSNGNALQLSSDAGAFLAEIESISSLLQKKIKEFKHPDTSTTMDKSSVSFESDADLDMDNSEADLQIAKTVSILHPSLAPKAEHGEGKVLWKKGVRRLTMVRTVINHKEKFTKWARILRRMDPRFQILEFFDQVAQRGADALVDCDVHITGKCTQQCLENQAEKKTIKERASRASFSDVFDSEEDAFSASNIFNQAGVFTVWRPTSLDSIRKMMVGDGVGKGLDIKGKSAKMGQFSGFVPFLQLHEERHKTMVRTIPNAARMRVYYTTLEARDHAHKELLILSIEMLSVYSKSQKTIERIRKEEANGLAPTDPDAIAENEQILEDALNKYMWEMDDPTMTLLDDYAPKRYGIELPQRLFFEAYVMRGNCAREPGSIHETGRKSEPAFQDMNMETLRNFKPDAPRPVVLLKSDELQHTMDPRYLLIAYEDHGFVKPVVSDFDCFVVGTRRIAFDKPLPDEQIELMKWCIQQIEKILDIPPSNENWTMRWLEQLKKAYESGFHVTFPKYGFADPKSYSIMAHAIDRLTGHGSVRHGAECFNYYFPQDLDDEFLVVTNNQINGPWVKYTKEGLLTFLSKKIDEGFMFPVNPKWILCDPGWKELYDKQLASHNTTTIKAMRSWYPPRSGVRQMIDRIHAKHPNGFQMDEGPYKMDKQVYSPLRQACQDGEEISAEEAMDMAELEVNHSRVLKKAIKVMNGIIFAHRLQMAFRKRT